MSALTRTEEFSLTPRNLTEAIEFSKLIADSNFVPTQFRNKPGDVLVAVQMGSEVGLKPMQSLQNIAVINGKPSIWGDAALALVMAHPKFESIDEWEEITDEGLTAFCKITRRGQEAQIRKFSVKQATEAKLIGRDTYKQYLNRMLQMRARGFCIRDTFPDALKGLITTEEALDYPEEKIIDLERVPQKSANMTFREKIGLKNNSIINTLEVADKSTGIDDKVKIEKLKTLIEDAINEEELVKLADIAKQYGEEDRALIRVSYIKRRDELIELKKNVANYNDNEKIAAEYFGE